MSKRLQVLLEEDELREIQRAARRERLTVAEWVRQALREVRRQRPQASLERKLAAIRKAAQHSAPTADIDQMLAEIERGYQGGMQE
ncbi:MAG: antitoxin [Acidobacteria bacterium]|nr:antitoxin [Acidobacteriota bacterium]